MKNVQLEMNVARQRRKITHLVETAPPHHQGYLAYVLNAFDEAVSAGLPQPAKEFLGAYYEEFDIAVDPQTE